MVDELHTFAGPQGTDLACLIRRLRERLQVPRQESPGDGLVRVGTSATVGDEGNSAELRQYAADVFGQAFDEHTILREERQSIDEPLGTAIIQTHVAPQPNLAACVDPARYVDAEMRNQHGQLPAQRACVDPARYVDAESYLKAQHELFFGAPIEGDFHAVDWRIALAEKLRGHLMFVNLLRTLADSPLPLPAVAVRMRTSLPLSTDGVQAEREAVGLLNGLCALISAALEDDGAGGAKPFLCVGLHLWVRELRRMVCRVAAPTDASPKADSPPGELEANAEPATTMLRHSDDLNPEDSALHLPLVQCRECRSLAGARCSVPPRSKSGGICASSTTASSPETWTCASTSRGRRTATRRRGQEHGAVWPLRPHPRRVWCRERRLHKLRRRRAGARVLPGVFNQQRQSHRPQPRLCPFCNASEALIIVEARASSLLSVVLGQTFASRHNDDAGGQAESAANSESAAPRRSSPSRTTCRTPPTAPASSPPALGRAASAPRSPKW